MTATNPSRYLLATRPGFLGASGLAVLVGTGCGWQLAGRLDMTAALLALASILCLHAAHNVLNDLFDDLHGSDRINRDRIFPYTGGSRVLQDGILTRRQLRDWALWLLLAALLTGALLVWRKGTPVLLLGLAGLFLGAAYSAPPLKLAARGLGELTVALCFGLLPVTGAAWLQTGHLEPAALLLSWPVTAWATAILLINEIPDAGADAAVGKRTLAVRLPLPRVRRLYQGLQLGALPALAAAPLLGFSAWIWLVPVPLALAGLWAGTRIGRDRAALRGAIRLTLAIHALGCLWLTLAPWLGTGTGA